MCFHFWSISRLMWMYRILPYQIAGYYISEDSSQLHPRDHCRIDGTLSVRRNINGGLENELPPFIHSTVSLCYDQNVLKNETLGAQWVQWQILKKQINRINQKILQPQAAITGWWQTVFPSFLFCLLLQSPAEITLSHPFMYSQVMSTCF